VHSYKYAAALQHTAPYNRQPLLIHIIRNSGHAEHNNVAWYVIDVSEGSSSHGRYFRIERETVKWGFIAQTLGLKWHG